MANRSVDRSRRRFQPNLENLEKIMCLDAAAIATVDPLEVPPPAIVAQVLPFPDVPDPTEVVTTVPTVPVPDGNTIEQVWTNMSSAANQLFTQGVENLTQSVTNTINTLTTPTPDPAPGPIALTPTVTVVPDQVGPIAPTPILPLATPTTPVLAATTIPCLPNSCSDLGASTTSLSPYTVAIATPWYFNPDGSDMA